MVAAGELSRQEGLEVDLLEATDRLGGLQRSVVYDGLVFDIGGFFFDHTYALLATFPRLAPHFVPVDATYGSVTPAGEIDSYPCSARGYLRNNGIWQLGLALADACTARARHRKDDGLYGYLRHYLGHRFVESTGLQAYVERLFGSTGHDIDAAFALQRIPQVAYYLSLRRLSPRTRSRVSIHSKRSGLVRPPGGFDFVYDRIREQLEADGVGVHTACRIENISCEKNGFTIRENGAVTTYDRVVSTIPLATTSRLIGLTLDHRLEWIDLHSLFYRFIGEAGHAKMFLHNFSRCGMWKRITTYSHMYGSHNGVEYFTVEITGRQRDRKDVAEMDSDFRSHVGQLRLYAGDLELLGSETTPFAYPVLRYGDAGWLRSLQVAVRGRGIELAGRQATFQWLSSDDTADQAKRVAAAGGAPPR